MDVRKVQGNQLKSFISYSRKRSYYMLQNTGKRRTITRFNGSNPSTSRPRRDASEPARPPPKQLLFFGHTSRPGNVLLKANPICFADWTRASDFHQSSIKWNIGCGAPSDWNSLNFNCVFNLTYSCREEWHRNAEGRSIFLISPRGIDESIRPVDWKAIKTQWLGC